MVFVLVLTICYLLYMKDFSVLKGIVTQQGKFTNSIFTPIVIKNMNLGVNISRGFMLAFILIYMHNIIKLIFRKKQYGISDFFRKYQILMLLFLFGTITNFQIWYITWLIPAIMWQNSEKIKLILNISILAELASINYFIFYESYKYGQYYIIILIGLIILFDRVNVNKLIKCK